ncbi:MAG TPA: ABC transporter permease [Tepidisphaeraceae bacterium]|jgi:ABC-2 type transport system permease protein|nr:ABC transporter permease [Tepidisphaeraceae bacterium]
MSSMRGFLQHLWTSLKLNFRNPMAVVMGYLLPIIFLLVFGAFLNTERYKMSDQIAQLLTISILGGACFGLPIAFVSERERGVWRRYKLTPMPTRNFVISLLVARFFLVLTAGILQIVLARVIYRTPLPVHPIQLFIAFTFATFAFLGIGLIISMVADTVTSVQAWGQAIFLPMLIIGGVAIPLRMLPKWGPHVAAFLPGRYAVHAMDAAVRKNGILHDWFALLALLMIGAAGFLAGVKLFRWENNQKIGKAGLFWAAVAVGMWAVVGLGAEMLGLIRKF